MVLTAETSMNGVHGMLLVYGVVASAGCTTVVLGDRRSRGHEGTRVRGQGVRPLRTGKRDYVLAC
ncbi:hypothetical protein BDW02DRAFT_567266 [Decorospora gaudefroyi]|uniref:Uncharacterized protein n=1 Tax=Decorospora gaudefroyi TaxID=184978 RepID=A0A6A5KLN7_9PLEO|nr:hypothetical protein BDW02DRAFT_567266 [Decorospora gaudefroyi]